MCVEFVSWISVAPMDASLAVPAESVLLRKANVSTAKSLAAHNSPVSNKRHRLNVSTTSLASCSSHINNNYANLDVDSLEDMLQKVCIILAHSTLALNAFRSYGSRFRCVDKFGMSPAEIRVALCDIQSEFVKLVIQITNNDNKRAIALTFRMNIFESCAVEMLEKEWIRWCACVIGMCVRFPFCTLRSSHAFSTQRLALDVLRLQSNEAVSDKVNASQSCRDPRMQMSCSPLRPRVRTTVYHPIIAMLLWDCLLRKFVIRCILNPKHTFRILCSISIPYIMDNFDISSYTIWRRVSKFSATSTWEWIWFFSTIYQMDEIVSPPIC